MKLVTFTHDNLSRVGAVIADNEVVDSKGKPRIYPIP